MGPHFVGTIYSTAAVNGLIIPATTLIVPNSSHSVKLRLFPFFCRVYLIICL